MTEMPTWDGFNIYVLRYLNDAATRSLGEIRQGVVDLAFTMHIRDSMSFSSSV